MWKAKPEVATSHVRGKNIPISIHKKESGKKARGEFKRVPYQRHFTGLLGYAVKRPD